MKYVTRLIVIMTSCLFIVSCASKSEYRNSSGMIWNTMYTVTYQSDRDLSDTILAAMNRVEQSLSPFIDGSLITAINRNQTDSVDGYISLIFNKSQEVNQLSGGAFDPTVAPLINLWGFGYVNSAGSPTDEDIQNCLASVGISDCRIDGERIIKKSPETEFNFSAITKGFGCDEVGRALERNGCENYMIEIGGELALKGMSPRGTPWRVMVDAPIDTTEIVHEQLTIIDVTNCGIATSGNYRNFREGREGRYGHTISPVTGYPVKTQILSATVIAPDAMTADALATASMALPLELAREMFTVLGEGYGALFVIVGESDEREIITTPEFPPLK